MPVPPRVRWRSPWLLGLRAVRRSFFRRRASAADTAGPRSSDRSMRRSARRGTLGHVISEGAPNGRRRRSRDRSESLGDQVGGEREDTSSPEDGDRLSDCAKLV